jgi:hypothetical protein
MSRSFRLLLIANLIGIGHQLDQRCRDIEF